MSKEKEKNNDELELKPSREKLYIAIVILALLIASFFIRTTTLIQNQWVNMLTQFMIDNVIDIIIICGALITLYAIEIRKFYGNVLEEESLEEDTDE